VRWPARPAELRAGLDFFWFFLHQGKKNIREKKEAPRWKLVGLKSKTINH